jgi:hypothetical protein
VAKQTGYYLVTPKDQSVLLLASFLAFFSFLFAISNSLSVEICSGASAFACSGEARSRQQNPALFSQAPRKKEVMAGTQSRAIGHATPQ